MLEKKLNGIFFFYFRFRIRSDNNIDGTIDVLNTWLNDHREEYHSIDLIFDDKSRGFEDEKGISDWSNNRFFHVIKLREEALNFGRRVWADFIFVRFFFKQ